MPSVRLKVLTLLLLFASPCSVFAQVDKLFWTNRITGSIDKIGPNGQVIQLISGLNQVNGIEVTSEYIYFTEGTFLRRAELDGTNIETLLEFEPDQAAGRLAHYNGFLYWTTGHNTSSGGRSGWVRLSDLELFEYADPRGFLDVTANQKGIFYTDSTLTYRLPFDATSIAFSEFEYISFDIDEQTTFRIGGLLDSSEQSLYYPRERRVVQHRLPDENSLGSLIFYDFDLEINWIESAANFQFAGDSSYWLRTERISTGGDRPTSFWRYTLFSVDLFPPNSGEEPQDPPFNVNAASFEVAIIAEDESSSAIGDMAYAPPGTIIPQPPGPIELRIEEVQRVDATTPLQITFSWPSEADDSYEFLSSSSPIGPWTVIATITATSSTTQYDTIVSRSDSPKFFQVRELE